MLSVKNIAYRIKEKNLLEDISADFEPGNLNLVIGPNGAGKSTLIRIICNQVLPTAGVVKYGEKNLRELSAGKLAKVRAVLSQNVEIAFPLKVHEVVIMGRYCHFTGHPAARDLTACEEAMRFFDVFEMAERDYMTLSGGEKQRVHFARVLCQIWHGAEGECRYLLLDEPLTFLDVRYQFDFMNKIIQFMRQNKVVVIGVVHDLNLAARFADTVLLLHQGKLLAKGTPHEVLTEKNIQAAYGLQPVFHREKEQTYLFFK